MPKGYKRIKEYKEMLDKMMDNRKEFDSFAASSPLFNRPKNEAVTPLKLVDVKGAVKIRYKVN